MSVIRTGGGAFNPADPPIYFLASDTGSLEAAELVADHFLVAVNELRNDKDMDALERWCDQGKQVFIDSGIFNLTNVHARKFSVSMDVALSLAPEEIGGFDDLFDRYVSLVRDYGDRSWGYIELDQGGMDNKIRTRAKLEALGLRPIPVYHPLNDGWDYFDYLAERYDRICFGNIVQADRTARKKLVATMHERHRKYPHLWIHLLGLTPNAMLNAMPSNSADSSTWLSAVRWTGPREFCDTDGFSPLPRAMAYAMGSDEDGPTGHKKARALAAYQYAMLERNWRGHIAALERLGCERYPAPAPDYPASPGRL